MDRCMLAHQTSGNLRIFSLKNNVPEMFLEKLWDAQYSVRFLILLFYAKIEKLTHFKNCEISDTQNLNILKFDSVFQFLFGASLECK